MEALRALSQGTKGSEYDVEVERLLSCPICLEVYSKPVVILPCQHNLCRKCANDVFQNRGTPMGSGGRFRCPTCRYEVMLDRHGVYGLQRNLLVENIIDMYQTESKKPFRKVEVLLCEEHEEEKVNIFCVTCQKPTCSLCKVFGQHQECTVAPMDQVYKDHKTEISGAIAMLVAGNDKLQTVISKTEELISKTEENSKQVQSDVSASFDKLYSILEERKQSMLCRIKSVTQEKTEVLQEMLRNYGNKLEGSSKLVEEALSLLEEPNAPQFLSISRELINRVTSTARATDVSKPPANIHEMDMFEVDLAQYEVDLSLINFPNAVDASDACEEEEEEYETTSDHTSINSEGAPSSSSEAGFRAKLLLPKTEEAEVVASAAITRNEEEGENNDDSDDSVSIASRSESGSTMADRLESSISLSDAQLDSEVKAIAERYLSNRAARSASQASARSSTSSINDVPRRSYSEENSKFPVWGGNNNNHRCRTSFPEERAISPVVVEFRPKVRSIATLQVGAFCATRPASDDNSANSTRSNSPVPEMPRSPMFSSALRRRGSGNLSQEQSPDRTYTMPYQEPMRATVSQRSTEGSHTSRARRANHRNPRNYATHRRRTWSHLLDKKQ